MEDRRFEKRLELNLDAVCRLLDGDVILNDIRVVNINHTGMCFISDRDHPQGRKIEMDVAIGDQGHALLNVEVVWSRKDNSDNDIFRCGVRIIESDTEDLRRFRHFYSLQLLYPPNNL